MAISLSRAVELSSFVGSIDVLVRPIYTKTNENRGCAASVRGPTGARVNRMRSQGSNLDDRCKVSGNG